MFVIKRNGSKVAFEGTKITKAVLQAMRETDKGEDQVLAEKIAQNIEKILDMRSIVEISIEDIQDMVEEELLETRKDVAKRYIIYRSEQLKKEKPHKEGLLSEQFLSKYKHIEPPMTEFGKVTYYRSYSRFIPEEKRREHWWETVKRAVEYNCSLLKTTSEEAELLFDNIFNLKQFLSGRTFWVGGTEVSRKFPMANYNCSFQNLTNIQALKDITYLLMIGSGTGIRLTKDMTDQFPKVRGNYTLINKDFGYKDKEDREENTSLEFIYNNTVIIHVGDSKEGWTQSIEYFFKMISSSDYNKIETIIISYDNLRPRGSRLNTFGGTASGYECLAKAFSGFDKVIKNQFIKEGIEKHHKFKLKPINFLDIVNLIGEAIVAGGVRRTAENIIFDVDDLEIDEAKSNLYYLENGKWTLNKELEHRQVSNNSKVYKSKPTRLELKNHLNRIKVSGEPGFVNEEAAKKRRSDFHGLNPCFEILLDNQGLCNLTTLNVFAFVDKDGKLDRTGLLKAQKLSAKASYRMTCIELEIDEWDRVQQRDRLTGCSLTGWQDMVNALNYSKEDEAQLLRELRDVATEAVREIAKENNLPESKLITTVKPEGTLSQLPTVSSGVHYSHSPYFIRRIRISANDPIIKACEELGYPIFPEVGQSMETCHTKVVEFPIKAPKGRTKMEVSAIEQLENYKLFMDNYVQHNTSITVHVRENEWNDVEEWLWNNWDDVIAVSFLSLDDSFYQLLPYEEITEEEYNRRKSLMKPFRYSLITKYEKEEEDLDVGTDGCETGSCPVR